MLTSLLSSMFSIASVDCLSVTSLASRLQYQGTSIPTDCCSGFPAQIGLTCVSNRVTEIDWTNKQLQGTLDGQRLSSMTFLTKVVMGSNNIQTISNPTSFPASLTWLDLSNNGLSSFTSVPTNIVHLDLGSNAISGSIPILPSSLRYLDLNLNMISGSVPILPSNLNYLDLSTNWLSGSIPTLPLVLTTLYLDGNSMSGDVPNLPSSLNYLDLSSNKLTGTVNMQNPTTLKIVSNYITDVIISDTRALSLPTCDLSNNPLLENTKVAALTMCIKNSLYSANLLPKTLSSSSLTSSSIKSTIILTSLTKSSTFNFVTKIILQTNSNQKVQQISTGTLSDNGAYSTSPSNRNQMTIDTLTIPSSPNIMTIDNYSKGTVDYLSNPTSVVAEYSEFVYTIVTETQNANDLSPAFADASIVYYLVSGIAVLFILLLVLAKFIKSPSSKSKYGRKNSFGTLNTVNTKGTAGS